MGQEVLVELAHARHVDEPRALHQGFEYLDPTTFGRTLVGLDEFVAYNFAFFDAIPDWRSDPLAGRVFIDATQTAGLLPASESWSFRALLGASRLARTWRRMPTGGK